MTSATSAVYRLHTLGLVLETDGWQSQVAGSQWMPTGTYTSLKVFQSISIQSLSTHTAVTCITTKDGVTV